MKCNRNIKRKGFTLIELLIVIVVIGILSAMMMLSSTEAVTSARASNIVSNLRNFKTAAMAMYVDNLDTMDAGKLPTADGNGSDTDHTYADTLLVKYMNMGNSGTKGEDNTDNYHITVAKGTDNIASFYVYCDNVTDPRVQEKLKGRAQSVGLLASTSQTAAEGQTTAYYTSGNTVYMFVTKATATSSN